jgi:hypothetical protein
MFLFLNLVSKTDQSGSMMFKSGDTVLAGEDVEVRLHALQRMNQQFRLEVRLHALQRINQEFRLVNWGIVVFENCIVVRK